MFINRRGGGCQSRSRSQGRSCAQTTDTKALHTTGSFVKLICSKRQRYYLHKPSKCTDSCMATCAACAAAHRYTDIHGHTQTHRHTWTHMDKWTHRDTSTDTHGHTDTPGHTQTHTDKWTQTHTDTHGQGHTETHGHRHVWANTDTHRYTWTHTDTCGQTRTSLAIMWLTFNSLRVTGETHHYKVSLMPQHSGSDLKGRTLILRSRSGHCH